MDSQLFLQWALNLQGKTKDRLSFSSDNYDAEGYLARHADAAFFEVFYWVTILVSNTLGTALGDFVATNAGLGFERGALVFAGLIGFVALVHLFTDVPQSILFWAAYVLTRPLGATLGDTLTKPYAEGGMDLSRITSSLIIVTLMVVGIILTSRRTERIPNSSNLERVESNKAVSQLTELSLTKE